MSAWFLLFRLRERELSPSGGNWLASVQPVARVSCVALATRLTCETRLGMAVADRLRFDRSIGDASDMALADSSCEGESSEASPVRGHTHKVAARVRPLAVRALTAGRYQPQADGVVRRRALRGGS